jgi:hypothetical protein
MTRALLLTLGVASGCFETGLSRGRLPDPADPPERELDLWGQAPTDWQGCFRGMRGLYYNLTPEHADVEPDLDDTDAGTLSLDELDWWSGPVAFQRYDGTTDFGGNWWPVDGGFQDDPKHFAARWVGWFRVTKRAQHSFVVGGSTDLFLALNEELVIQRRDRPDFETETVQVELNTGVYQVDLRYAHRFGEQGGFRFRVASPDILSCYPDYPESD